MMQQIFDLKKSSLREIIVKFALGCDFESHAIISFEKQCILASVIHNIKCKVDYTTGLLSFNNQQWKIQLLGTESDCSKTWLWAWANFENGVPDRLLKSCRGLRIYGKTHSIPELITPQIPLVQVDTHALAMLASGFCKANAYFRCPYDGGALYVLIMDDSFPKCSDPPLRRIATVFPQAIASLDISDHKLALSGYLNHYGLGYERDGNKLVVRENGEAVLTATFDEQSRLTKLEVNMNAPAVEWGMDLERAEHSETWDQAQLRRMLNG